MNREGTTDLAAVPSHETSRLGLSHIDGEPSRTGRAIGLLCVAATILTSSTIAYLRLRDSFVFYMDDFLQFDVAARTGLSKELLTLDVFQHFAPINRLGHLFMLDVLHLDPREGAVVAAALVGCVLTATAWMIYELGMPLLRRCLVLAACGGSLSFLDSAVWSDAAWHILGALTATYLVVALHLRALRTGNARWHMLSVVAFTLGLLTQERAAFALPLIVLTDVILVWHGATMRQRLGGLWALRVPLLAMAIVGAVAAAYIKASYASSPGPGLRLTLKTVLMALTSYQFPQLAGVEPEDPLPLPAELAVLLLIVLVCAGLVWLNRRNLGPILYFFACFGLYWGFLAVSPLLNAESVILTAARLNNASYLTVPAFVAIFHLRARRDPIARPLPDPAIEPASRAAECRAPIGRPASAGVALVVGLLVYVTVMGGIFVNETWGLEKSGHAYLARVTDAKASLMDPGLTIVPMAAPTSVVQQWATSYGRTDHLLTYMAPGWAPGDLTARLAFFDQDGHLVKASVQELAPSAPTDPAFFPDSTTSPQPGTSCLSPSNGADALGFDLEQQVPGGGPLLARITYTSSVAGQLSTQSVSTDGTTNPQDLPYQIQSGSHTALHPLPQSAAPILAVNLVGVPAGATFCVSALSVVRPLLAQSDGSCLVVDRYGTWISPPTTAPCSPESGT